MSKVTVRTTASSENIGPAAAFGTRENDRGKEKEAGAKGIALPEEERKAQAAAEMPVSPTTTVAAPKTAFGAVKNDREKEEEAGAKRVTTLGPRAVKSMIERTHRARISFFTF